MKIYVTGDVHGFHDLEKLKKFSSNHKELTKKDYVIVLGDLLDFTCGDDNKLEGFIHELNNLRYTLLFIDGDSDDYDYLNKLEIREFGGGKVQYLSDSVIHLIRGEIYDFSGTLVCTFGGSDFLENNYDLKNEVKEYSYVKKRVPSLQELKYLIDKLKVNSEVDYMLTHESPSSAFIYTENVKVSHTTKLLDKIDAVINCKRWYFGHYHHDMNAKGNKTIVYKKFIRIK